MSDDTSIIFVVDPPFLVPQAVLLISSIRRHLGNIDVKCYCPENKLGALPRQFLRFAEFYSVAIEAFHVDGSFEPHYPHGNKLFAAKAFRSTSKTLFLDTDTVIWQAFDPSALISTGSLSAAPEGRRTWGKLKHGEDWNKVYHQFNLSVPTERVELARTNASSLPYFNAGVVGFSNSIDGCARSFGQLWFEYSVAIDQNQTVPNRRPWVDQIALPIAATKAGWSFTPLPKSWNLSLSRHSNDPAREIDEMNAERPYILHYHKPRFLKDTRYDGYFDSLLQEFTAFVNYTDMMQSFLTRSDAISKVEDRLSIIRRIPKRERTTQVRSEFFHLKNERLDLVHRQQATLFDRWPENIQKSPPRNRSISAP